VRVGVVGAVSGLHLGANGVFPKWTFQKFAAVRHCVWPGGRSEQKDVEREREELREQRIPPPPLPNVRPVFMVDSLVLLATIVAPLFPASFFLYFSQSYFLYVPFSRFRVDNGIFLRHSGIFYAQCHRSS